MLLSVQTAATHKDTATAVGWMGGDLYSTGFAQCMCCCENRLIVFVFRDDHSVLQWRQASSDTVKVRRVELNQINCPR